LKVALCMFGQPRVIQNKFTFQSHLDHVINKYETDVYCHSWISNQEKLFEYSDWVDVSKRLSQDISAKQIILEQYKPKRFLFEEPKQFSLTGEYRELAKNSGKCPVGGYYWSENNENNLMSQLYSISKSIRLLDGEKYDWVILSRYDNYIENIPSLYELEQDNLYLSNQHKHFVDVLMLGSQKEINTMDCFDDIPELCKEINYFTPEEFKRASFKRKFYSEKRIDIVVGIARTNTLDGLQK
jgi:hypothetical protein